MRSRTQAISERFLVLLSSALLVPACLAGEAPRAAAAISARAVDVACEPALPFFCRNIHVGCSGQTELRTFAFRLRASAGRGWIEAAPDTAGIGANFAGGRIEWGEDAAYVIVRPQGGDGYIKLLASGKYSLRHYAQGEAVMAYGSCR